MFFIPGFVLSALTFPGVIIHEIAHLFFCRLFKLTVFDVCFFQMSNPSGYVVHEVSKKPVENVMIGVGPFIINTILGSVIAFPASIPVLKLQNGNVFDYFLMWLGISILMHSFPSSGDAKSIWKSVKAKEVPILTKILTVPIVGLIYICSLGSIFWLDYLYGIAMVTLLPNLIVKILA